MQANQSDLDHLEWLKRAKINSFSGLRLLDLGCGSGYICHKAAEWGAALAVGVDVVKPSGAGNGWTFQEVDLNAGHWHEAWDDPFDLILAFDIIEHLDSPFQFLSSCRSLLSKEGKIVITTPNVLSWERFYNPRGWSGVQDPQHKVLFTKYSLEFLLG